MDSGDLGNLLTAIKTRAEDIRRGLIVLQQQFEQNQCLQWPNVLEQFAVLNSQYNALNEELKQDSILLHFVPQPQLINIAEPNQIPELLRTKELPEMEIEEHKMIQQYDLTVSGQNVETKVGTLQGNIQQYNSQCEQIEEEFEERKEQLNMRSKFTPQATESNAAALRALVGAVAYGYGLKPPPSQPQKDTTVKMTGFPHKMATAPRTQPMHPSLQGTPQKQTMTPSSTPTYPPQTLMGPSSGMLSGTRPTTQPASNVRPTPNMQRPMMQNPTVGQGQPQVRGPMQQHPSILPQGTNMQNLPFSGARPPVYLPQQQQQQQRQ